MATRWAANPFGCGPDLLHGSAWWLCACVYGIEFGVAPFRALTRRRQTRTGLHPPAPSHVISARSPYDLHTISIRSPYDRHTIAIRSHLMSSDGIRSPPVTPSPLDPLPTQSTPPNVVRSPTATSCSCGSAMVRTDRIGSSPVRCHTGCVRSADPTHCAGRKRRGLGSCSSVLSAPSPPPVAPHEHNSSTVPAVGGSAGSPPPAWHQRVAEWYARQSAGVRLPPIRAGSAAQSPHALLNASRPRRSPPRHDAPRERLYGFVHSPAVNTSKS